MRATTSSLAAIPLAAIPLAALVMIASLLVVGSTVATAQAGPSIEVSVRSRPAAGVAVLEVTGSGFAPFSQVRVAPCEVPEGGIASVNRSRDCDLISAPRASVDADGNFKVGVRISLGEHLAILVDDAPGPRSVLQLLPQIPVAPTLAITPASVPAIGEHTFTVAGDGYTPGESVFLVPCVAPDGDVGLITASDCDISNLTPATIGGDGGFMASVTYEVSGPNFAIAAGTADQGETAATRVRIRPDVEVELVSIPWPGRVEVRVTGAGFAPNAEFVSVPCRAPNGNLAQILSARNCNVLDKVTVVSDSDGAFSFVDNHAFAENLAILVDTHDQPELFFLAIANPDQSEGNVALVPFPEHSCRGIESTLIGTDGDDDLRGTDGPDVINVGAGNDVVRGAGGDDIICGGSGDDRIFAGSGNDYVFGDSGVDKVRGGFGRDSLFGGPDMDFLLGGADDDTLDGDEGPDRLRAGSGDDLVLGRKGRDVLWGGLGDDRLIGGPNQDILKGGSGTDDCTDQPREPRPVFIECESP